MIIDDTPLRPASAPPGICRPERPIDFGKLGAITTESSFVWSV
jgi:hypothetical protein